MAVASREWNYAGTQGDLAARTWSAEAPPSYVVLLAHGYGEHVGRYERVADALVARGAVVYAVDHLGHGKSDGERVLVSDFEDVVTDLHTLDVAAREEQPGSPVVLVGHSMGGLIAARYAQRYGDTLAALVLSGPLIGDWQAGSQLLALEQIPEVPLDIATLSRDPSVGTQYAADPLVWHGPFKRTTLEAIDRAIKTVGSGPRLGTLPLLWVHGQDDQLVPIEGSRPGVEGLRGNQFVERSYPGARHEIFNELNAAEVLLDVTDFLTTAVSAHRASPQPDPSAHG